MPPAHRPKFNPRYKKKLAISFGVLAALLSAVSAIAAHVGIAYFGAQAVAVTTTSQIHHLVVIVQENHTFDNYFGQYCKAPVGSNPECNDGPDCCEAGPDVVGAALPTLLNDAEHAEYCPPHDQICELEEMNGGKMDRYVTGSACSNIRHFAYADPALIAPYLDWASRYALADRYFQAVAGASSSNDMYLARAAFEFTDNDLGPPALGASCPADGVARRLLTGPTIGDLLSNRGVSWTFFAEGYGAMADAHKRGVCPVAPADCAAHIGAYPCIYDPGDDPFAYFATTRDNPLHMQDLNGFTAALKSGQLPAVSYIKNLGYKTEHPGTGVTISAGVAAVKNIVDQVLASPVANDTLVLLTYDESGGYYDHVAPPATQAVGPAGQPGHFSDGKPYGPRIPMLAIGRFARKGQVSHVVMEHSSVVKFIEWNWLGGKTGQLGTRDTVVNNLGSLLDLVETGVAVPEN